MTHPTIDIQTAATLLGVGVQRVRKLCAAGKLAGAAKAGRTWRIPRTAHVKFADAGAAQSTAFDLTTVGKGKQDAALWRLSLIQRAAVFCGSVIRSGGTRRQAIAAFARDAGVGIRSLQRWMSDYRKDGIAGLVDGRGRFNDAPEVSASAWDYFLSLYLDLRQPSVRQCYDVVCFENQQKSLQWQIPSLRRVQQMVHDKIPLPVRVLHREGQGSYDATCAPYIEVDLDAIAPGSVWIGDHHQCDCWVRYQGQWIRPWLTAWEDMRSRTMVGWKITDSPNSTTILLAFRNGCERFGPPEGVKIDNGKDYDSELFTGTTKQRRKLKTQLDTENVTGLYAMMDISVSFAIPYHPQAKAIERWFDTFEGQFVRTMPTYCGKDTQRRPEHLFDYMKTQRGLDEAMEMDEFAELVEQYIGVYNNTAHSGRGMNGLSPMTVMAQRDGRRMLDADTLKLLCQVWTGKQKVGKNGVTIRGLRYGQFDTVLHQYFGREVRCTYDPEDITAVRVYDANTHHYITTAEQATLTGYQVNESDVRKSAAKKARANRAVKQYKPAARIANTDLTHLSLQAAAARTQAPPETTTPALRPVATVLDGQAAIVKRTERMRSVRRAAGAENMTHVPELHLETETVDAVEIGPTLTLDPLPRGKKGTLKLSLFNE